MREIDFRMYSSDKKGYFYDTRIVLECLINQKLGHIDYVKEGYAFEQFTGLLDKNGTKIFEGDLIISPMTQTKLKVVFVNGCFQLASVLNPTANLCLLDGISSFTEVIGNIHEVTP